MSLIKHFILSLIAIGFCSAQNSFSFEHLTTKDGLSQNDINTICQDQQGFMWFGTHDGLNKFDGYKFTVYNPDSENPNSINSNLIFDIISDKKSNLWIATTGSGLNYFDKESEKFKNFVHDNKDSNSISNNNIAAIFIDSQNRLWVSTNTGIDILDLNKSLNSPKFQHYEFPTNGNTPSLGVLSFFEDSNKQIWIGTLRGLFKVTFGENNSIYFKFLNQLYGLGYSQARSIAEDKFGHLIVATSNGLFIQTETSNKLSKIYEGNYNEIIADKENIWAGTNTGFIHLSNSVRDELPILIDHFQYDPKNKTSSLSKNGIKSLFLDNTGVVWIGTNGGGINKFDPNRKQFNHIQKTIDPGSLSNDKIRAIFEDSNETLWIGTDGGGLNMLLKEDNNLGYNNFFKFDFTSKAYAIAEVEINGKKKLLVGSENTPGLHEIDINNPKKISEDNILAHDNIPNSVFSIIQDKDKNIWIGTYNGGIRRWIAEPNSNEFKKDILIHNPNDPKSLANNIIRDIVQDSKGNIWFATSNGLSKMAKEEIHKKNPKFENYQNIYQDTTSLSHNYVLTIFESHSGAIWVGTFGGGLNKYIPPTANNKGSFKRFSKKNGLPNHVIKGILEDDAQNLWISTNKGLSKFNMVTEIFKNYDANDGLQSDEFGELARFKTKNNEFMFGGVNGLNTFFPDDIKDNTIEAETVFTGFSIFNKPITIGEEINGRVIFEKSLNYIEEIKLKHDENSFSVEFASVHYAASRKNQYAYKLEGFNNDWLYTTSENRIATYTNLEPGNYNLVVKASNNDGVWNETPIQLNIEVIPPFWKTTIAKIFYLLLFILCLIAFRRYTIISTSKKYDLELEHLEKEKYEEINRLKLEFFTNISHEFRTPLTLIKGPLEYLLKLNEKVTPKEVKEQCTLMHKNTEYLLRLINQLMDFRKMDRGQMNLAVSQSDIVEFLKVVGEPYQLLSHKKLIDFKINASKKNITTWFDYDALEKITNNLLSNAFKFTPDNGSISIDIFDGSDFTPQFEINDKPDKSNYVIIQVKDSGPGIPQHRIKHIFERYYTEIDKKGINPKGTGIGLSFVKTLVELHQGFINVHSDSQTGSLFTVWLPKEKKIYEAVEGISFYQNSETNNFISKTDAEIHALSIMDDIVDENISKSRSKLPVLLIVDDNADIRSLIKKNLGEQYYVYEAENGEKGLELANRVIPNIIITDLMMPVMDGVALCNKLKTTQETSHIPVIMLTAKMSQEWEIEGLKTGADGYIRKPFDMKLLELKLNNILKNRDEMRKRFNREITLQPGEVTMTSTNDVFLQKAIEIVEEHMMDTEFSVELLVKEMNSSRTNLYLKIKELTGLSCSEFIRSIRLKRAIQLLEKSNLSVKEIMYMTGFNTASYFSKCFKKQFGVIPSKYIRQVDIEETNTTA